MDAELVQVLAESGIKEVPTSFVQQIEKPVEVVSSIPVIDMEALSLSSFCGSSRKNELKKLAKACEEWGFFQVVNHSISIELIHRMKQVCRDFFQLPTVEKQKVARDSSPTAIDGYGRYNTSSESVSDWVDVLAYQTAPPNMKVTSKWPAEPPMFRYVHVLAPHLSALAAAISETLGLPAEYIRNISGEYSSIIRINYYPPCPQADKVLGISPHSDGGTISVLIEDSEGLQIRKDGNWIPIQATPGALIVNAGDMLQVISNGKYRSVEHRASVSSSTDRVSIVTFYFPSLESPGNISPAEQLVTEDKPSLYKSITFRDYLTYYNTSKTPGKARVDSLLLQK